MIPIVDIFAGPGGLAEGFSRAGFDIRLSIEMDKYAHQTLRFRSFSRKLINSRRGNALKKFYTGLIGETEPNVKELASRYPELWKAADQEALRATLGKDDPGDVSDTIEKALGDAKDWVLLGGPPCQAYSLVGRSRMAGTGKKFENDHRHLLYREYLRIVAAHAPSVFVMENVKGLLSSDHKGSRIFEQIKQDLQNPRKAIGVNQLRYKKGELEYELHPLWSPSSTDLFGDVPNRDFIVKAELQGVPQARHRLFIVGVRKDLGLTMQHLRQAPKKVTVWDVLNDLPKIHSNLSKEKQLGWLNYIKEFPSTEAGKWTQLTYPKVYKEISKTLRKMNTHLSSGSVAVKKQDKAELPHLAKWFKSAQVPVALNHESRGHMPSDLHRYLYSSAFSEVRGVSPKLREFPPSLLPAHKNINKQTGEAIFEDRFRTQCKSKPSTTVTSHIHKDGHYFIHPEPSQCRSLTVREAARLQTFPDDYLFCGPRTEQFKQVGNAVPPYLAFQIANVIKDILS